jgi:hypothetical protein
MPIKQLVRFKIHKVLKGEEAKSTKSELKKKKKF